MAPQQVTQLQSNEANIQLAIWSIRTSQIQSNRSAAKVYNVAEATLRRRRAGMPTRRDCQPNSKKLTQLKEQVIFDHVLDLDQRRFGPSYLRCRTRYGW